MRTKGFIKFLERERLRSVLYERLKWQKSHGEINQLFDEFSKLKIVWWMPSVAESAKGKKFSQGQVIVVLLLTGAVACSLYERYRMLEPVHNLLRVKANLQANIEFLLITIFYIFPTKQKSFQKAIFSAVQ